MIRCADDPLVEASERVGKDMTEMMSFAHMLHKGDPGTGEGVTSVGVQSWEVVYGSSLMLSIHVR